MDFTEFVRVPFIVQATQVTEDNFEEVAKLIGKEIKETPAGKRYILIDRRIIPNGHKAMVGGWVTVMDDKLRYYSATAFAEQFIEEVDMFKSFFQSQQETQDILDDPDAIEAIAEAESAVSVTSEDYSGYVKVDAPDVSGADV